MRTANADGATPPSPRKARTTPTLTCRHHGAPKGAYAAAALPPSLRKARTTPTLMCRHHGALKGAYAGAHAGRPAATGE